MSAQEPPAPKVKKGLWESLSPEDQKKAATVFLVSVGVTLLVTGRSGGKLLKRAKAAESVAPAPTTAPRSAAPLPPPPRAPRPAPTPAPARPAPTAAAEPVQPPVSTKLPSPPPMSFLHPNSLAAPKPRRFLPSFVSGTPTSSSTDTPLSVLSSRPSPSSYFLPNPALTAQSTAFAAQLDKLDKLHEDGEGPPPAIEDGFNPAVYAAKAFGIASAITLSVFGAGIWGVMKWLDVDDVRPRSSRSLARARHEGPH